MNENLKEFIEVIIVAFLLATAGTIIVLSATYP
jgi:hypothetical protein